MQVCLNLLCLASSLVLIPFLSLCPIPIHVASTSHHFHEEEHGCDSRGASRTGGFVPLAFVQATDLPTLHSASGLYYLKPHTTSPPPPPSQCASRLNNGLRHVWPVLGLKAAFLGQRTPKSYRVLNAVRCLCA